MGIQKSYKMSDGNVSEAMKWAGHVKRMNEDRQPSMAYVHQKKEMRRGILNRSYVA